VFCNEDINFFDDELVNIAQTGGLFAIQMDANRLAPKKYLNKTMRNIDHEEAIKNSAKIIWRQIQHIAEVLDKYNLNSWNIACIGSDFDGSINPLNGIWTTEQLPILADQLLILSNNYLKSKNKLTIEENKNISPEEIVDYFTFGNTLNFLKNNY
jgi:microsomal dipeptidase-like Zn-dependent dipeptidase